MATHEIWRDLAREKESSNHEVAGWEANPFVFLISHYYYHIQHTLHPHTFYYEFISYVTSILTGSLHKSGVPRSSPHAIYGPSFISFASLSFFSIFSLFLSFLFQGWVSPKFPPLRFSYIPPHPHPLTPTTHVMLFS